MQNNTFKQPGYDLTVPESTVCVRCLRAKPQLWINKTLNPMSINLSGGDFLVSCLYQSWTWVHFCWPNPIQSKN